MKAFLEKHILYIAWVVALIATLGSLYFSEIALFPPCVLCWYQRIAMYPIVLLLAIGIMRKDTNIWQYVLPLSLIGFVIAVYHNLLYYQILPESIAPCTAGISCTTQFIEWFGFITIPLLSLVAFAIITAAMVMCKKMSQREVDPDGKQILVD